MKLLPISRILPLIRYRIEGHSMEPTLADAQVVWAFQWAYLVRAPKVGEIVVFHYRDHELVKRVVEVVNGEFRLAGDNQNDSFDSRKFGLIKRKDILGKVFT